MDSPRGVHSSHKQQRAEVIPNERKGFGLPDQFHFDKSFV